jgi:hypothetical protein
MFGKTIVRPFRHQGMARYLSARSRGFFAIGGFCGFMDPDQNDKPPEESADDDGPKALNALPVPTREHSLTLADARNVMRRFNRTTTWVATGLLGAVICAAAALVFQDNLPMAANRAREARRTNDELLPNASPVGLSEGVGSNGKSADEIAPEQLTGSDPGSTPEINNSEVQAKVGSWSTAQRQDSARVIRPRIPNVRRRSSMRSRLVDVKTRLIMLWHQSLARIERSRGWTLFSYPNKARRKKVSYAAETTH